MSVDDHDQNRQSHAGWHCELVPNLTSVNEEVGWLITEVATLRTEVGRLRAEQERQSDILQQVTVKKARTAEHPLPDGDQLNRPAPPTRRAPAPPKGKGKGKEMDPRDWELDMSGFPAGIYKANEIRDTGLPLYHVWKKTGQPGVWSQDAWCLLCGKWSEEGHRASKSHLNQLWHMLDAGWPDYEVQ